MRSYVGFRLTPSSSETLSVHLVQAHIEESLATIPTYSTILRVYCVGAHHLARGRNPQAKYSCEKRQALPRASL